MYIHLNDELSRYDDELATIREQAARVDAEFEASAAKTGGHRSVRWVTDAECRVVVDELALGSAARDLDVLRDRFDERGLNQPDRVYMVWWDATTPIDGVGGIGWRRKDDSHGRKNVSNLQAGYAIVWREGWDEHFVAHELMHTLGAVQASAPHSRRAEGDPGHCSDGWDEMCAGDPSGYVCSVENLDLFDCHDDDYFSTSPPSGSYLATHWNTADSGFLYGGDPAPPLPDSCLVGSAHPYPHDADSTKTITNPDAHAAWTQLRFARVDLVLPDSISVRNADGSSLGLYGGFNTVLSATFDDWSPPIQGRKLAVKLQADGKLHGWGYCVDALRTYDDRPANDRFAAATVARGTTFRHGVRTYGARLERGEPQPGSSRCYVHSVTVWYRIPVKRPTKVTVSARGGYGGTQLAAYRGRTLKGLSPLAGKCTFRDDGSAPTRIRFTARPGQPYYVQVGNAFGFGAELAVTVAREPA